MLAAVNAARATPGNGAGRRETTAPAPRADVVLAGLEELASAGPVLVTADDVQWADPATMQAFRSMPRLLASYPLSWILAMGASADAGQAELLFDLLENDGAARITLGPLDLAAQVALVGDVLAPFAPQAAAELAIGALALALLSDPGRPTPHGRRGQGAHAQARGRPPAPPPPPASLLALTGRAAEAMTEVQTVLTNFDVPADLRDDATVALLWAWLGLRGNRQVDQLAGIIPGRAEHQAQCDRGGRDGRARRGQVGLGPDYQSAGPGRPGRPPGDGEAYETTYFSPHLLLAPALIYVRRLDEATAITNSEHAEGLLAGDASRLQHAADQLADPWARACAVEDQGALLAAAGRDDEAIRCLEEALMEYGRLGARRGVARTRRRLRQLGVRRRHWASERRPTGGWASPTSSRPRPAWWPRA